jgi:hypothetical protein
MFLVCETACRAYPVHRAVCLSARQSTARCFIFGFGVMSKPSHVGYDGEQVHPKRDRLWHHGVLVRNDWKTQIVASQLFTGFPRKRPALLVAPPALPVRGARQDGTGAPS